MPWGVFSGITFFSVSCGIVIFTPCPVMLEFAVYARTNRPTSAIKMNAKKVVFILSPLVWIFFSCYINIFK